MRFLLALQLARILLHPLRLVREIIQASEFRTLISDLASFLTETLRQVQPAVTEALQAMSSGGSISGAVGQIASAAASAASAISSAVATTVSAPATTTELAPATTAKIIQPHDYGYDVEVGGPEEALRKLAEVQQVQCMMINTTLIIYLTSFVFS